MNKRLTWCGICLISYLAMGQSVLAQEQSESTLNMPISTVEASAVEVKSVEEQLDSVNIIVPDKEISAQQEEQVSVSLEEAIDSETDEQQKLLDKKEIAEETLEKVLEPSTAVTDTEVKEEGSKNEVSEKLEAEEPTPISEESDKETKVLSEVSINLENKEDDTERAESNVTKEQNEKENTTSFRTNANEDRYHKVKVGDTLWAISQRYNITLNDLLKLNNFSSANVVIHPGNLIKVSKATGTSSTPPQNNTNNGGGSGNTTVVNSYYTVVSGDSLWRIANQHGISVAELVTLNGWASSNQIIHPGQQVIVKKAQSPSGNNVTGNQSQTTPSTNQTYNEYYTIVSGDSLWLIANKYGISVDELVRLNGWASSNQMIHPGQQVIVKKGTSGKGNVHSNADVITAQQLIDVGWVNVTVNMVNELNECLKRYDITTVSRISHFISQCSVESGAGRYVKELASGYAYNGRLDLGNIYAEDGPKYKGVGYLQMTGRNNYTAFANHIGDKEVVNQGADYVAKKYAWTSAGFWWHNNGMNHLCDLNASVRTITRKVNGGSNFVSERQNYYNKILQILK